MEALRVGICGLGTVAQGVLRVLQDNADIIRRRAGREILVSAVASRTLKPGVDLGGAMFSPDVFSIPAHPDVDVVVELIGGEDTALRIIESSIEQSKNVVTANKAVIALHGKDLFQSISSTDLCIGFEGAIAGSVPIVMSLSEALIANEYKLIAGIINGTSNYILTAMAKEGRSFDEALREAQKLGYAEADPTFDVEGIDAAHKLTILAAMAFDVGFHFEAINTEGISGITLDDIKYAGQLGYEIKHVGIIRQTTDGIQIRVHPALISSGHLLSRIDGSMNAVLVNSNAAGDTLMAGPGAGELPTASAVVGDLMRIARRNIRPININLSSPARIVAIENIISAYYLRIPSLDRAGVFAKVATILSEHGISIEAAIQKEQIKEENDEKEWVPIVILTHVVQEKSMIDAIRKVQDLPEVIGTITRIRVEQLGQ